MAIQMSSLRAVLISTSVLFTAGILILYLPLIMDFVFSETVLSWMRPPYLYFVINCIIITIVASSKLQNKIAEDSIPETVVQPLVYDGIDVNSPVEEFAYGYDALNVVKGSDFDVYETVDGVAPDMERKTTTLSLNAVEDVSGHDEKTISKFLCSPQLNSTTDYSFSSYEKPSVSLRIGHRKAVRLSPEGGKTLRVSKPKRHDETLESTWKTITEGRSMPLARHLRKSDTWETHGCMGHLQEQDQVIKSETLNDRTIATANRPALKLRMEPSESGKLKREPSPSQDELNRRVEAFITKFNVEMRLQKQESLNQYMEMIKRGSH